MLAGISSDYYLRLEQGRDHHPSAHVLNALARALQLDEHATAHLHSLSQPTVARRRTGESERAPESVTRLIASWSTTPAFVQGRHMDVLAANALASAVSPVFSPGVNIVQATFLDPEVRRLVGDDWDTITHNAVARLRALAGSDVDDPRLGELVGELSARSERFRSLWARHDIEVGGTPAYTFNHPLVGLIRVNVERFGIISAEGQLLILHHADPGSPSERALLRLADLTAASVPGGPRTPTP